MTQLKIWNVNETSHIWLELPRTSAIIHTKPIIYAINPDRRKVFSILLVFKTRLMAFTPD